MIGTTNSSFNYLVRSSGNDEHTVLLIRDKLVDESKNHNQIYPSGNNAYPSGAGGEMSAQKRDGRNAIIVGANGYYILGQPNIIDLRNDYTIEFWRYTTSNASGSAMITIRGKFASPYCSLLMGYYSQSNNAGLYVSTSTSGWDILNNKTMGTYSLNTWSHMALSKTGTTYYCFKDGTLTYTYTGSKAYTYSDVMFFGIGLWSGTSSSFSPDGVISGFLQDIRVSDICRYTSDFTPPQRL